MSKPFFRKIIVAAVLLLAIGSIAITAQVTEPHLVNDKSDSASIETAIFAGGCFWCVESDYEKLPGVVAAVSGYTGGAAETANYKQVSYTETGHYEAVKISYDATKISFQQLVDYFWLTIDPTDADGQFCDKGSSYKSAIFYANDAEKEVIVGSLVELDSKKEFDAPIVTEILPRQPFYDAEDYHQNYYRENPIRYRYYRNGCGRDKRLKALWGKNAGGKQMLAELSEVSN